MSNIDHWRSGAQAGDPIAQLQLALALLPRASDQKKIDEALRWIEAARRQNSPQAYIVLAVLSVLGIGAQRNLDQSYQFLKRAAELGSGKASAQLDILSGRNGFDAVWLSLPQSKQHFTAPRIYSLKQLLPEKACAWLIELARPRLAPSTVFDADQKKSVLDEGRTSYQAGFNLLEPDVVLALVNLRMAAAMGAPLSNFEVTTIMQYTVGQEYKSHYDIKVGQGVHTYANELKQFGQRAGTLLIYLSDDYAGGETEFPDLNWRFKGQTGDALMFWSLSQQGEPEYKSCHAGLPVISGEKWLLSKWLREKPYPWA